MNNLSPVWFDGTKINLPPAFGWGNRIMGNATTGNAAGAAEPVVPGFLNINRTQDVAISLTTIKGAHTLKGGFYNNHSFKAQNTGAGGVANLGFQGYVNFGNDTNNALDTGFGFANAAMGVFSQYLQQSKLIEGSMIYNNTEFYAAGQLERERQAHARLRRAVHAPAAAARSVPADVEFLCRTSGAGGRAAAVYRRMQQRRNGLHGQRAQRRRSAQRPDPDGGGRRQHRGGDRHRRSRIRQVHRRHHSGRERHRRHVVRWPTLAMGAALRTGLRSERRPAIRPSRGGGLFYDRPDGNTVFSIPGNPPMSTSQDLRNGQLQTLGTGLSTQGVPALIDFQYDAKLPSSWQWQAGMQFALPWAAALDVTYVGNHGFNRLRQFQGGAGGAVDLNAVDIGAAYLPQNQDPTLGPSTCPARALIPRTSCGRSAATRRSTTSRPGSGTSTTRSRCRSIAVSGTGSRSAPTTTWAFRSRATRACSCGCSTRRTARSRSVRIRRRTNS